MKQLVDTCGCWNSLPWRSGCVFTRPLREYDGERERESPIKSINTSIKERSMSLYKYINISIYTHLFSREILLAISTQHSNSIDFAGVRIVPQVAESDVEEFIQQELDSFAPMTPRRFPLHGATGKNHGTFVPQKSHWNWWIMWIEIGFWWDFDGFDVTL